MLLPLCLCGQGAYRLTRADIGWVAGGVAWAGGGQLVQSRVAAWDSGGLAALDAGAVPAIDRLNLGIWRPGLARASDVGVGLLCLSPLALFAGGDARSEAKAVLVMGAEVALFSYGTVTAVKGIVHRTRPYAYGTAAPLWKRLEPEARLSFVSGHTAVSAAACFYGAKVFHDLHPGSPWRKWVWAGAALAPAGIAALRVGAGRHFLTDVAAGYAIGAFTGWLVPQLHRRRDDAVGIAPIFLPDGAGMALEWRF